MRWRAPELHAAPWKGNPGVARERHLVFSGEILYAGQAGEPSPLTWRQVVRVGIARRHGEPLAESTASWADAVSDIDGSFRAHFDTWAIDRVPGETLEFEVGLVLPDLEPDGTYRETQHLVPTAVTRIAVAGPPVLPEELRWINACSPPERSTYDPISIVRAVNRLRELGKERALQVLRDYAHAAPQTFPMMRAMPPRGDDLDFGDSACVFLIARLLFVPDPGTCEPLKRFDGMVVRYGPDRYPLIYSRMMYAEPPDGSPERDDYPFLWSSGLPFFAPYWLHGRSGYDGSPLDYLDWAEKCAHLREAAIVPTGDPIEAAEQVARSSVLPPGNDPRRQIWLSLAGIVAQQLPRATDDIGFPHDISAAEWESFRGATKAAKLHWDKALQQFVATKMQSK